ncbi:MAG: hypothetical protein H0U74_06255, partial [Bradymonadaceae bacterium]|nr:hypothetical protein [Lujinxingiaceae bacterium]
GERLSVCSLSLPSELVQALVAASPLHSRFELATVSSRLSAKHAIASGIVDACSSLTGTIAALPIPLADIVPITGIQLLMIGSIAYLSGREMTFKSAGEFAVAASLNLGAGFAVRQVVRSTVRLVPVAGPLASVSLTTAGTYALGRAAMAYFLD